MFRFEYTVTEDDYAAFNLHHLLVRTPLGWRGARFFPLSLPILLAISAVVSPDFELQGWITPMVVSGGCVLYVVFYRRFLVALVSATIAGMKKRGKPPYSPSGVLTFDDDGVLDAAGMYDTKWSYAMLEAVEIDKANGAVYLYNGSNSGTVIPAGCFADGAERERFLAFVREKAGLA